MPEPRFRPVLRIDEQGEKEESIIGPEHKKDTVEIEAGLPTEEREMLPPFFDRSGKDLYDLDLSTYLEGGGFWHSKETDKVSSELDLSRLPDVAEKISIAISGALETGSSGNFILDLHDFEHLRPDARIISQVKNAVNQIKKKNDPDDFLVNGKIRLRTIYNYLNEEVSFEDIQLSLFFI